MERHSQIESLIREFVSRDLLFGRDVPLHVDDSFLEKKLLDSTGVLELMLFLETTFGIVVDDSELVPENMDSIGQLRHYVESKLNGAASRGHR